MVHICNYGRLPLDLCFHAPYQFCCYASIILMAVYQLPMILKQSQLSYGRYAYLKPMVFSYWSVQSAFHYWINSAGEIRYAAIVGAPELGLFTIIILADGAVGH